MKKPLPLLEWSRAAIEERFFVYGPEAVFVDGFERKGDQGTGYLIVREDICRGHFRVPQPMICPGHILIETAAQTVALLWLSRHKGSQFLPVLSEVQARFLKLVLPGQTVRVLAKIKADSSIKAVVAGCRLYQGSYKIAEMELKAAIVPLRVVQRLTRSKRN